MYFFKFLIIVIAFIAGVFIGEARSQDLKTEVFDNVIQVANPGGTGFCTGTIIHSDRDAESGKVTTIVLTAKHCVDGKIGETVNINQFDYNDKLRNIKINSYPAKIEGSSYKSDLAVIKLKDEQKLFKTATVADRDIALKFGDPVVSAGYPLGLSLTYTHGNLGYVEEQTAFKSVSNTTEFFRATPDIAPGSSGGGLFVNDNGKYKLIGVVTGGSPRMSWFNYFTPVDEINDYLDVAGSSWTERKKVEDD